MLKPEIALPMALALGVAEYAVFQVEGVNLADVKGAQPHNTIAAKSITTAGWTCAGLTAAMSILAKDYTIAVVGGTIALALVLKFKHANVTEPMTGKIVMPPMYTNLTSGNAVSQTADAGA
jgi:hypothetical protein